MTGSAGRAHRFIEPVYYVYLRGGVGGEGCQVEVGARPWRTHVESFFALFRSLGALGSHLGALGPHLVAKLAQDGAKMGENNPT